MILGGPNNRVHEAGLVAAASGGDARSEICPGVAPTIASTPGRETRERTLVQFVATGALFSVCAGAGALVGRVYDLTALKGVGSALAAIEVSTACAFIAAGVGLWYLRRAPSPQTYRLARFLALYVTALGAAALVPYIVSIGLGVDLLLPTNERSSLWRGTMSPAAALNFVFLGVGLCFLRARQSQFAALSHWLVIPPLAVASLAIVRHAYGIDSLPSLFMGVHTAVLFLILSLSILVADTRLGWTRIALSGTTHGALLVRWLLPATPLVLFLLGWIRLAGERAGLYDGRVGLAVMVLLTSAVCILAIGLTATVLNRRDVARLRSEARIAGLNSKLEQRVQERTQRLTKLSQELREANTALEKLAYFDPLTGLANRTLYWRELDRVLSDNSRAGAEAALLLLDLDRFKEVNDCFGHAAGDELLVKVARSLARLLDKSDLFARLGGDEFAVVVPRCEGRAHAERIARQLIKGVSDTVRLERGETSIGVSIGVVMMPQNGTDASDLLRKADLALYRAKAEGRGRFAFFTRDMSSAVQSKLALAHDLRRSVRQKEGLMLHYQPQVDLRSGQVTSFEALLRWTHPTRGNVSPSEFIPIAESSGLICELGAWTMREAAVQARAWLDMGELPRRVAVNISATQILHTDIVREIKKVLKDTELPRHLLSLELTESVFADHSERHLGRVLGELKRLGVTLALDDFGTEYSSLSRLTQLPFDALKIDRLFVHDVKKSGRARELLRGIIALGHGLGMQVCAEGAETSEELSILRELGCDTVQGFVFARAMAASRALAFARGASIETSHQTDELPASSSSLPRCARPGRAVRDRKRRWRAPRWCVQVPARRGIHAGSTSECSSSSHR
ncbi:MAG: EAL domain-containing protein [Hyphomicrobium sp.]|uniref:putative bifunctional diguanylate cyclase/phosphodiesterase n=1 Tax=Hyphomicrobium sp. TaxID=82 RepID=UPI00132981C4|nr:EAL domain-containing protein [Hyphomicrobium sp.]KAB2937175.1 MAG: EAL domain-containing protein [Hyphomicrobium sp.]MBZ0210513.1 EAL domain-containing protein [Hyphomicrobium sp.]